MCTNREAIRIYRHQEINWKKNHGFICASSWNRAVYFIDSNFDSLVVKYHVIDFRSIRWNQSTFIFNISYRSVENLYSSNPPCFVYWDFLRLYLESNAKKKSTSQNNSVENGSLRRAFNELLFSLCTFTDFYDLDAQHWNGSFFSLRNANS